MPGWSAHHNFICVNVKRMLVALITDYKGDDDDDDHMGDQESAWKQAVPPYYRASLFCGLPPTRSRSIPYFEFSPQMSQMIRANIGCRRPGLGYPTPDWEAGGQIDGTAAADAYGLM